jgi:enoyl-CoA hydratase/carnithine racemase
VTVTRPGDGRIAIVTFNDPKKLNALNADMGEEFKVVVNQLCEEADSENLGAVVLTGEGRAFSAGGDLKFLRDRATDTPTRNATIMRRFYERFLSVRRLPVPVVAAINGPAIGAGLAVALACDVRIAAADAKMGITFVGLGLHPGMGSTHFLPRLIGNQMAAQMMLTGQVIDGKEAHRIGLVSEMTETPESCVDRAVELARQMSNAAPLAVRTCVRSLRMQQDEGLEKALWREADAQSQVYNSKDYTEGLDALVEKRKPVFGDFESLKE